MKSLNTTDGNPAGKILKGKTLQFKLEDAEKLALGIKCAQLDGEADEIRAELKEASAEFKQRLKERTTEIHRIQISIRTGIEERECDCTMTRNADGNSVSFWVRGKMIEERAMTFEERQEELDMSSAKSIEMGNAAPAPGSVKRGRSKSEDAKAKAAVETDDEIADIRKLETGKRTKRSSVDGAYADPN